MGQTLFERIGGEAAVSATVARLYERILNDDRIAHFFDDVDINTLRRSQSAFVKMAFGGPNHYTGKGMRNAHAPLVAKGLNDSHFDAVAGHLVGAMQELDVPQPLIDEAIAIVETTRDDVLNK